MFQLIAFSADRHHQPRLMFLFYVIFVIGFDISASR